MDRAAIMNGETGPLGGSTSGEEEIQQAIVRLPKRQREALDLLELERLSYDEIAARMGTSHGSVAQLISRARINLYDELRGTPLASVAAPSPECERSLPLIAAREDGQLDLTSDGDAAWLNAHLAGCDRCRPAVEQMAEAAASYRAWAAQGAPDVVAPAPLRPGGRRPRRRTVALVATSLALLLFAGLAAALVGGGGAPAPEATEVAAPGTGGSEGSPPAKLSDADSGEAKAGKKKFKSARGEATAPASQGTAGEASAAEAAPTPVIAPAPAAGGGGAPSGHTADPNRASGKPAVNPPKQVSTSKPSSKSKPAPTSTQASQPAPEPQAPSSPEASPPAEEAPDKPGRSGEAPGKPADRPPR